MAKATTPHPIQGKIGQLIYTVRNGKQFVHQAPGAYVFRKGTPALGLNRREFAGAAKVACDIYNALRPPKPRKFAPLDDDRPGPVFGPYTQNLLTGKLKKAADRQQKSSRAHYHFADTIRFRDAAHVLVGLDLGHAAAPAERLRVVPVGPRHDPHAIRILGLAQAAAAIPVHGNARLEFRLHLRQARFIERAFCPDQGQWLPVAKPGPPSSPEPHSHSHLPPSAWIPASIIPSDGLSLPLPTGAPGAMRLSALIIEWRIVHAVGRKTVRLHRQAIVRIVAMHAPAEAWESPGSVHLHPHAWHHAAPQAILRRTAAPPIDPLRHPAQFLAAALARMRPT